MKKIILTLAGMLASISFAPNAFAIPAFARQVGMACSACHYQHFPVLNSFGRAFKAGGYTMIGAQEKIEAEGLSLPGTLNAALVGYAQYQKSNGPTDGSTPTGKTTNDGQVQIPQQVSLFLGGRVGEHIGFETEINVSGAGADTGATTGTGLIRLKIPFVYDVGSVKAGIIPFSTAGLGVADSFEVLNTGAVAVHAFNQTVLSGSTLGGMQTVSAQQYIGTGTAANGVAFIASNENFFANFAKWGANVGAGGSGGPSSNYLRAAWTPGSLVSGFDSAIGVQIWSGSSAMDASSGPTGSSPNAAFGTNGVVDTKASAVDAQLMGDVAGMPLLVVASYANAPASDAAAGAGANFNLFNTSTSGARKSLNIGAELGVIPNKATVQFGIRRASAGVNVPGTLTGNATDNAIMLGGTYNIALNVRAELTYTKASGDMYNPAQAATAGYLGDTLTTLDLAFGF